MIFLVVQSFTCFFVRRQISSELVECKKLSFRRILRKLALMQYERGSSNLHNSLETLISFYLFIVLYLVCLKFSLLKNITKYIARYLSIC